MLTARPTAAANGLHSVSQKGIRSFRPNAEQAYRGARHAELVRQGGLYARLYERQFLAGQREPGVADLVPAGG